MLEYFGLSDIKLVVVLVREHLFCFLSSKKFPIFFTGRKIDWFLPAWFLKIYNAPYIECTFRLNLQYYIYISFVYKLSGLFNENQTMETF